MASCTGTGLILMRPLFASGRAIHAAARREVTTQRRAAARTANSITGAPRTRPLASNKVSRHYEVVLAITLLNLRIPRSDSCSVCPICETARAAPPTDIMAPEAKGTETRINMGNPSTTTRRANIYGCRKIGENAFQEGNQI